MQLRTQPAGQGWGKDYSTWISAIITLRAKSTLFGARSRVYPNDLKAISPVSPLPQLSSTAKFYFSVEETREQCVWLGTKYDDTRVLQDTSKNVSRYRYNTFPQKVSRYKILLQMHLDTRYKILLNIYTIL